MNDSTMIAARIFSIFLIFWTSLNVVSSQQPANCAVLAGGIGLSSAFDNRTVSGETRVDNESDVITSTGQYALICLVTVAGSGSTAPAFRWTYNSNNPVAVANTAATACSSTVSTYASVTTAGTDRWNATLVLCSATRAAAGLYNLSRGSVLVSNVHLYALALVSSPANIDIEKGKTATLQCQARGYRFATITWWRNGQQVSPDLDSRFTTSDSVLDLDSVYVPATVESTFQLSNAAFKDRDDGLFQCRAVSYRVGNSTDAFATFSSASIIVRVRDPLAPLWPVLGLLAQAGVLAVVLVIDKKRKSGADITGRVVYSGSDADIEEMQSLEKKHPQRGRDSSSASSLVKSTSCVQASGSTQSES